MEQRTIRLLTISGLIIALILIIIVGAALGVFDRLENNRRLAQFEQSLPHPPGTAAIRSAGSIANTGNGNHCGFDLVIWRSYTGAPSEITSFYSGLKIPSPAPDNSVGRAVMFPHPGQYELRLSGEFPLNGDWRCH